MVIKPDTMRVQWSEQANNRTESIDWWLQLEIAAELIRLGASCNFQPVRSLGRIGFASPLAQACWSSQVKHQLESSCAQICHRMSAALVASIDKNDETDRWSCVCCAGCCKMVLAGICSPAVD